MAEATRIDVSTVYGADADVTTAQWHRWQLSADVLDEAAPRSMIAMQLVQISAAMITVGHALLLISEAKVAAP